MTTRTYLTTAILSLTACADLDLTDQPAPAPAGVEAQAEIDLAPQLEARVVTALAAGRRDLRLVASEVDELGITHVRVRQLVRDIPVWEGEAIVHVDTDGTTEITDERAVGIDVDPTATIAAERAEQIARDLAACDDCTALAAPDLWVVRDGDRARLAWRVRLTGFVGRREVMPIVFVDAHDGGVVRSWDNVQAATGNTQYDGTRTIPSFYYAGRYYLEDSSYNLAVYDLRSGDDPDTDPFSRLWSSDTVWTRGDAAQAMFSARNVAEYFWGTHQRWNPDGAGGPGKVNAVDQSGRQRLSVFIDAQFYDDTGRLYGSNATWTGVLKLGRGDTDWGDLTSLDIVGHEFTHGVVEYTAGLTYMNESGALNESIADVFGAMAERYRLGESERTWRLGEDAVTPGVAGDELRRMDDPTADGASVDHYSNLRIGTTDNGYVHTNSGIGNKAFHLVANGGTHRLGGTMRGVGADDAARIWYRALTTYLTSGSGYASARSATVLAARDLFGYHSPQWNAVANAWALVGLGVVSNDAFENGGFESDDAWALSGRAYTSSGYPRSGTRYLVLGGVTGQSAQALQDFAIDPYAKTATLSFYLNVTSADTTSATDKLYVDVLDADTGAAIYRLGTWSNLDRTSVGVYAYKGAFNLSLLRGRSVRLKFYATNDAANATTFRVDDVRVTITR